MQNSNAKLTPLVMGTNEASRQAAYRAVFRTQLDDEAIADIRVALARGQPLGSNRFAEDIGVATGIRRTRKKPGRPARVPTSASDAEAQVDFGF